MDFAGSNDPAQNVGISVYLNFIYILNEFQFNVVYYIHNKGCKCFFYIFSHKESGFRP